MKQNRINKLTTILIKATLALTLGMFVAYNLNSEAFAINYSVTYHDNFVSNMPVDESASTLSSSVTLPATTPTRDGFQFKGWCTTLTADGGTCSGTSYAAGGAYTINQVASNNLTLYAVWEETLLYMQDMSDSDCVTGTPTTVYDNRDEKKYKVQRLADGKCWMLDNLALNPVTLTYDQLYGTGSDAGKMTNASSTTLGYLKNGGGSSPYTNYAVATATSTNYLDRPAINADSIDIVPSGAPAGGAGSNKVGVYYNYCAASAGSYCYEYGVEELFYSSEDLCPAGWHMPSVSQYQTLYNEYSSASGGQDVAFRNALSLPLSGHFYGGSASDQGSSGVYLSSNVGINSNIISLYVTDDSIIVPMGANLRSDAQSLRCIMGDS